ncbi:hypothetical protein [Streptomyces coerulescens]|uniref:Uncharacterized protein n=1 Tax=Streptomyces coerulescens TaxID=29304 RepID=A0ABW0CLT2_STRCD
MPNILTLNLAQLSEAYAEAIEARRRYEALRAEDSFEANDEANEMSYYWPQVWELFERIGLSVDGEGVSA